MALYDLDVERLDDYQLEIVCPVCGAAGPAEGLRNRESARLLFVTVYRREYEFARCGACRCWLRADTELARLCALDPATAGTLLRVHRSPIQQLVAVLAVVTVPLIVFFWLPTVAIYVNRRTRGWPLAVSWLGLVLTIVWHVGILIAALTWGRT